MEKRRKFVNSLYFVVIVSSLLVNIATVLLYQKGIFDNDPTGLKSDSFFTMLTQWLLFTIIPLTAYAIYKKTNKNDNTKISEDFGFNVFTPKMALQSFVLFLFVGTLTLTVILLNYLIILQPMGYAFYSSSDKYTKVWHFLLGVFLTGISPAFGEEIFNRGLLYSAHKKSPTEFILRSALLFALMHQNIQQFAYTFLFGGLIACMMYYTKSIWCGVLVHFLNNGLQVLYQFAGDTKDPSLHWLVVIQERLSIPSTGIGIVLFLMRIVGCTVGVVGVLLWMKRCAKKRDLLSNTQLLPVNLYDVKQPVPTETQEPQRLDAGKYLRGTWKKDIPYFLAVGFGAVMTAMSLAWRSIGL